MRFALNHIVAPRLSLASFFELAGQLGMSDVEIRNDIPDIVGTMKPETVKAAAEDNGLTIISINALYPFNVWSGDLPERARHMADYASRCGARALVMCPLNDGRAVADDDLVEALRQMKPILEDRGLTGLVEPLGFPVSSLRLKAKAIEAIKAAGGETTYKLVHDTFHHHLAGETAFFPEWTGLVHISGVADPDVRVEDMLDAHRILIDGEDRLENIAQIRKLLSAGFEGPYSFEPFAESVHALSAPKTALEESLAWVRQAIG